MANFDNIEVKAMRVTPLDEHGQPTGESVRARAAVDAFKLTIVPAVARAFAELAEAFKPVVESMVRFAAEIAGVVRMPLIYLLAHDEIVRWAIERAGVTEADIRRVDYAREQLVLWNRRRIPIDVMAVVVMVQR